MIAARIPRSLSGKDVRVALERAGFEFSRQRGSHITLVRRDPFRIVVVPQHRQIKVGTLKSIIRQAGMTVEEFMELL